MSCWPWAWASVVPSPLLGCLFGKDWLESLGAVLDFVGQRLKLETLDKTKWVKLSKMRAGHFALYLQPPLPEELATTT